MSPTENKFDFSSVHRDIPIFVTSDQIPSQMVNNTESDSI